MEEKKFLVDDTDFLGVFSLDTLPRIIRKRPAAFIANTDPHDKPGTHWIAFYFPKKTDYFLEYFDSYGLPPIDELFREYIGDSRRFLYNNVMIQSPFSKTCGQHSIFYIWCRSGGLPPASIISELYHEDDTARNDQLVTEFLSPHECLRDENDDFLLQNCTEFKPNIFNCIQ